MPIASSQPMLQSQIISALSQGPAVQTTNVATTIGTAVASSASTGLLPGVPPIPVIPAGVSACIALISQALNMGSAAQVSLTAQNIAQAVSVCAPMVPPIGLAFLQSQIQSALSMGSAAQVSTIAPIIASAIITYYGMGTVI